MKTKNTPVRSLKSGVAAMDNKLVESCYRMTLTQKRLFNMAVAAVDNMNAMPQGNEVSVSIDDFAQLCNLSKKVALLRCRESVVTLSQAQIVDVSYKNTNVFLDDGENIERISHKNFFQEVDYVDTKDDQVVRFKFADWLVPYISSLKRKFTKIQLQHVNPLTSFYSMRLYEAVIFVMTKKKDEVKVRDFQIGELRRILGVEDDKYQRWVDFKKRCLVSSIADLNEKTPFDWSFTSNGRGKYLKSVTVKAIPNQQIEIDYNEVDGAEASLSATN